LLSSRIWRNLCRCHNHSKECSSVLGLTFCITHGLHGPALCLRNCLRRWAIKEANEREDTRCCIRSRWLPCVTYEGWRYHLKRACRRHRRSTQRDSSHVSEYFTMVRAGLAGTTPHMVSAAITSLSRLVFEFHKDQVPLFQESSMHE
jgi:hypothetical protein